jgi:dihydrofolate reductase
MTDSADMVSPKLIAIAAMARNGVIGDHGRMPWHLPEEFKWFKRATLGHAVLMGRKTFGSIGKPLPGRLNLVVTRTPAASFPPDIVVVPDLDRFDPDAVASDRIFVAGGAEIYARMLPRCTELWLTHLPFEVAGDIFFPRFDDWFTPGETLLETPEFLVRRYLHRAPVASPTTPTP